MLTAIFLVVFCTLGEHNAEALSCTSVIIVRHAHAHTEPPMSNFIWPMPMHLNASRRVMYSTYHSHKSTKEAKEEEEDEHFGTFNSSSVEIFEHNMLVGCWHG